MITNFCRYQYNPSEQYQRGRPGQGVETICGGRTYPANDEPELMQVRLADGTVEYRESGRYLPRAQPDPYCPAHGGSPEPPPPPVTPDELEQAYNAYLNMTARFAEQHGGALAAPVQPPALPAPVATPAEELQTATDRARAELQAATDRARAEYEAALAGGEA